MDLPILLSVRESFCDILKIQLISYFLFHIFFLVENANIHIKVFPKVETREGKEFVNIDKVRAKFTTTKWDFISLILFYIIFIWFNYSSR